jgi:hypothetical protein
MLRSALLPHPLSNEDEQVLLWGEIVDLMAMSEGLRARAAGVGHSSEGWLPQQIELIICEPAEGMSRDGDRLTWRIAPRDALHFAELIDVLAASDRAGHQYLDVDVASGFGIEVKISKGEYPETFQA